MNGKWLRLNDNLIGSIVVEYKRLYIDYKPYFNNLNGIKHNFFEAKKKHLIIMFLFGCLVLKASEDSLKHSLHLELFYCAEYNYPLLLDNDNSDILISSDFLYGYSTGAGLVVDIDKYISYKLGVS